MHVTATGLLQNDTKVYIVISKNGGFHTEHNFRDQLEKWFRSNGDQSDSGSASEVNFGLQQIRQFWSGRTKHYRRQVKKTADDANWEVIKEHRQRIIRFLCASDQEESKFEKEWKMVEYLRPLCQAKTDLSEEHLEQLYAFWRRPSLQRYPTPGPLTLLESRASDDSLRKYLDLVKNLELLAMPRAIWQSLIEFRGMMHEPPGENRKVVHIIFLQQVTLPVYTDPSQADWNHNHGEIAAMPVFNLLKCWQAEKKMNVGDALEEAEFDLVSELKSLGGALSPADRNLLSKLEKKIKLTQSEEKEIMTSEAQQDQASSAQLEKLRRRKNFSKATKPVLKTPKYLHCELQILMLLHQATKKLKENLRAYKFIGCSKLSCYMCWEVLKTREYKTRGTHGHIHKFWAFPFPHDLPGVSDQFKLLRRRWEEQFAKTTHIASAEGPHRQFETAPAHTAVPLQGSNKVSQSIPMHLWNELLT